MIVLELFHLKMEVTVSEPWDIIRVCEDQKSLRGTYLLLIIGRPEIDTERIPCACYLNTISTEF